MGGPPMNAALVDELSIRVLMEDEQVLLVLAGELDTFGAAQLEPWLNTDTVLDMADVSFIDSRGLRVVGRAVRAGRHVVVRHPSPAARRALDIVDLGYLIE